MPKQNESKRKYADMEGNIVEEGDPGAAYLVAGDDGEMDEELVKQLKANAKQNQSAFEAANPEAPKPQGKQVAGPPQTKAQAAPAGEK